jgi:DNA-binding transcriptional regulator YhcF (GntR family)
MHRSTGAGQDAPRLSYKFQRLREELRAAILSGEFGLRLPGERTLGQRFHANPKTINKALCDLSSEGLVVRHIGRGTFVTSQEKHALGALRRRTFRCLLPAASNGGAKPPVAIQTIYKILNSRGHDLEWTRTTAMGEDGTIALPSWRPTTRRTTDGLLCCPPHPLSEKTGRFSEDLVLEAMRRHVPLVALGACAGGAKLNAVVPDYTDAGFQISDYLYRISCDVVIAIHSTTMNRETAMAVNGCRTAAARQGLKLSEFALPPRNAPTTWLDAVPRDMCASEDRHPDGRLGVVCVGNDALMMAASDKRMASMRESGQLEIACISGPGCRLAEDLGLTTYEVDAHLMAKWAARLLIELRPGDRPIEVLVPGRLELRNGNSGSATTLEHSRMSHASA